MSRYSFLLETAKRKVSLYLRRMDSAQLQEFSLHIAELQDKRREEGFAGYTYKIRTEYKPQRTHIYYAIWNSVRDAYHLHRPLRQGRYIAEDHAGYYEDHSYLSNAKQKAKHFGKNVFRLDGDINWNQYFGIEDDIYYSQVYGEKEQRMSTNPRRIYRNPAKVLYERELVEAKKARKPKDTKETFGGGFIYSLVDRRPFGVWNTLTGGRGDNEILQENIENLLGNLFVKRKDYRILEHRITKVTDKRIFALMEAYNYEGTEPYLSKRITLDKQALEREGRLYHASLGVWFFAKKPLYKVEPGQEAEFLTELGLSTESTPEELKCAYRRMAKEHHPDRGGDPERFRQIKEAYEEAREHSA